MDTAEILKKISLFSALDNETLSYLQEIAVRKNFAKNTVLFTKGDRTNALYIICSGKAKAVIHDENGRELIISTFGPGEYFGEMAFLDGEERSATVITQQSTQVLVIYKDDFNHVLQSNPEVIYRLLKVLLIKLRKATEMVEDLAFLDVYRRLYHLFHRLAKRRKDSDIWIIEDRLTHQEIANMVGSSREMISKILKQLQIGGYITVEKKRIRIHKKLPSSF